MRIHDIIPQTLLRPAGQNATSDEGHAHLLSLERPGHVYRGMTSDEYAETVAKGFVKSNGSFSFAHEGTCFGDMLTAESYANVGQDDPRKTGKPTYIVEVRKTDVLKRDVDGYWKTLSTIPREDITRVWKCFPEDGSVFITQIA